RPLAGASQSPPRAPRTEPKGKAPAAGGQAPAGGGKASAAEGKAPAAASAAPAAAAAKPPPAPPPPARQARQQRADVDEEEAGSVGQRLLVQLESRVRTLESIVTLSFLLSKTAPVVKSMSRALEEYNKEVKGMDDPSLHHSPHLDVGAALLDHLAECGRRMKFGELCKLALCVPTFTRTGKEGKVRLIIAFDGSVEVCYDPEAEMEHTGKILEGTG
ncbi:unnamed protein product, partial [Prorocentrum cordatum]